MGPSWSFEGNALDPSGRQGRARGVVWREGFEAFEWISGPSGAAPSSQHLRSPQGGSRLGSPHPGSPHPGSPDASPHAGSPHAGSPNASSHTGSPHLVFPDDLWIIPGFIDSHTHLLSVGLRRSRPDLGAARSREQLLEMLASWLKEHPGDTPVLAEGWDQSLWADPALPTRKELDALSTTRVLVLRRVCGHVAVLGSAALRRFGTEWPDLDVASGLALEKLPLSLPRLLPPSESELDDALLEAQQEAWRVGVTGVEDMGAFHGFRVFARAQAAGRLGLRVTHFFGRDARLRLIEDGLVPGLGGDRLRVGGIKMFLDGSIGGRSAAVRAPYPGSAGSPGQPNHGLLLLTDEELREELRAAAEAGYQPAMHAIGDAAILQAISAVEALRAEGVRFPAPGPRLEHAEMLDEELLARAVDAGFLLSMQPNFTARWQNPGELYEQVLGKERAFRLNPYHPVARAGRLLVGSDTMPMSPVLGLQGALFHPDPAQRLSLFEALAAYTVGSARGVTHPFAQGELREGNAADFVLLRVPAGVREEWMGLLAGERRPWPEGVAPVATFVAGRCCRVALDSGLSERVRGVASEPCIPEDLRRAAPEPGTSDRLRPSAPESGTSDRLPPR